MPLNNDADLPWSVQSDSIGVWCVNRHGERMCDVFPDIGVADPFRLAKRICDSVNLKEGAVAKLQELEAMQKPKKGQNNRARKP